jgi:4-amino-4-deoxy-L-arabinose transferase-like glycosyltransferase
MTQPPARRALIGHDGVILLLLAAARVLVHLLVNGQYGFHRDELDFLNNARELAWGYVAYPPVTPLLARIGLELFGPSLVGVRLIPALAQATAMVLAGWMARDLGGGRLAQVTAALAVAMSPISLLAGVMLQYFSIDYLWWVVIAFCLLRRIRCDDPRWWLAVGTAIGLALLTKYTVAVFVLGIVVGVLLTPLRRDLRSPWLWGGVALALLLFLPNLIWQLQHNFISLEFLRVIRARDVAWGRTAGFLPEQLFVTASPLTLPLWLGGLVFYALAADRRLRAFVWLYGTPLVVLWLAAGRSYYLAPAYPMLLAAGAVGGERWLNQWPMRPARIARMVVSLLLVIGLVVSALLALPLTPVNSPVWQVASEVHDNFREMIGWPELVATVAEIYNSLPAEERARTAILAGNYGQAGAIRLYGPAHGLPAAISGVNSGWARGYGDPPPEQVIVLGFGLEAAQRFFATCQVVGQVTNRFGVENEESTNQPAIVLCQKPRWPWPELWPRLRGFG